MRSVRCSTTAQSSVREMSVRAVTTLTVAIARGFLTARRLVRLEEARHRGHAILLLRPAAELAQRAGPTAAHHHELELLAVGRAQLELRGGRVQDGHAGGDPAAAGAAG